MQEFSLNDNVSWSKALLGAKSAMKTSSIKRAIGRLKSFCIYSLG
jgi:hypothetical protein